MRGPKSKAHTHARTHWRGRKSQEAPKINHSPPSTYSSYRHGPNAIPRSFGQWDSGVDGGGMTHGRTRVGSGGWDDGIVRITQSCDSAHTSLGTWTDTRAHARTRSLARSHLHTTHTPLAHHSWPDARGPHTSSGHTHLLALLTAPTVDGRSPPIRLAALVPAHMLHAHACRARAAVIYPPTFLGKHQPRRSSLYVTRDGGDDERLVASALSCLPAPESSRLSNEAGWLAVWARAMVVG